MNKQALACLWTASLLLGAVASGCGCTGVRGKAFDVTVEASERSLPCVLLEETQRTRDTPDSIHGYDRKLVKAGDASAAERSHPIAAATAEIVK
jgi:hypothetical protein